MKTIALLIALLIGQVLVGDVVMPSIFSDNMVLSRSPATAIFGRADVGETIKVTLNDITAETMTGSTGRWRVNLDLSKTGEGPFELRIEGHHTILIKDVLIGQVWLASGQSNMAFKVSRSIICKKDIAGSHNSRIRMFNVAKAALKAPASDVEGEWLIADPDTLSNFSAVAYYFARKLNQELNLPFGIINSSVGGTPVEAWMGPEAVAKVPELEAFDQKRQKNIDGYPQKLEKYLAQMQDWEKKFHRADQFSGDIPEHISWQNLETLDKIPGNGATWLKSTLRFPQERIKTKMAFSLGRLPVPATVYFNGKKVAAYSMARAVGGAGCDFTLDGAEVKPGPNELLIRFFGSRGNIRWNSEMCCNGRLLGDLEWSVFRETVFPNVSGTAQKEKPKSSGSEPRRTSLKSCLYYGMISPLIPFTFNGVIWYQGEANRNDAALYKKTFPLMISQWRNVFENEALPFYFCQLAAHMDKQDDPNVEQNWAELRAAQTAALQLPNTGQAILIDAGEAHDIHPQNKHIPGERLANIVLVNQYKQPASLLSPVLREFKIEQNRVILTFDNVGSGLKSLPIPERHVLKSVDGSTAVLKRNSPGSQLENFALCAADGKWVWAQAKITSPNTVTVWSDAVHTPVRVRYAWNNNPTVNLVNDNGLPAAPFDLALLGVK